MYRLLTDENFTPIFSTFYKKLQNYRNSYLSTRGFDDLTKTEVEILSCVARKDFPNTAKGITKYLNVSKTLVSQNIESLVSSGYLERRVNPKDKRWQILSLGEKSYPLHDKLLSLGDDFYKTINKNITYEEMQVFSQVLKKMTSNLEEATKDHR
jgi:DNA-binding MarR family transcriptional regulator